MASLKKNVLFSTILTISNYLFPLITFPYVTRVLGVNNIGICNFVDSIVHYFIIFSMMGMMTMGIREIAKAKSDKVVLSRTYSSLLTLNMITTVIAIVVLLIATLIIPRLSEYSFMFYIGAGKILSNTLLIEWLYKGLEDFKFITARTILIRSIYVVSVIIFVKQPDDYILYFGLTVLSMLVNAVVNLYYSRKFVSFSFVGIRIKQFVKPFFVLGVYLVLTNMYTTFNVAYLGFVTNTTQVGYYTTATKLYTIIMGFFTAFTGVMLPRMSALLTEGKVDEFKKLTSLSVDILFAFAIPLVIIVEICTPQIIQLIAGTGYEGAILPMRIVMPLMLIIGYEQIIILQMLTPMSKDTAILTNSFIGAIVGIIFNIVLVSRYNCTGTAMVWVMSEISVMGSAQYFVYRYIGFGVPLKPFVKRALLALPIVLLAHIINNVIQSEVSSLVLVTLVTAWSYYLAELYILKNKLLIDTVGILKKRIYNKVK